MAHESDPIQRVLGRLEDVKQNGHGYVARCPAHDDRNPSLSVTEGDDGQVLLKCHTGCKLEAILDALKLESRDLFRADSKTRREIRATYDYTDEEEELLFQVVRYHPKDFRQRRRNDAGEWEWNLRKTRRVLYRLPKVLAAAAAGDVVYVVEGEKDVHALEAAGCVATCNPGGAGKWRTEYRECLVGARVVVVADKDEPGRKHAAQVAASLQGKAASVTVVEAKTGKDAADHLASSHRLDEFVPADRRSGDPASAQLSTLASDLGEYVGPTHTAVLGYHKLTWAYAEASIEIEASRVKQDRDGLKAAVRVGVTSPGESTVWTVPVTLGLMALRSRKELWRSCEDRFPLDTVNWDRVIEDSCGRIIAREEQGSPTVRLQAATSTETAFILGGVIPCRRPVLMFAPGGYLKSHLSKYFAVIVENGFDFLGKPTPKANTYILDYEMDQEDAEQCYGRIVNGLLQRQIRGDIRLPLYRRCLRPLADEVSEIAQVIDEKGIRLVVIDSAAVAAGGDLASQETTVRFFTALRQVTASTGAAALVLSHVNREDRKSEDRQRMAFGSIFWENLVRVAWELRLERERSGVFRVGLHCRKSNVGDLEAVGMRVTLDADALVVEGAPPVSDVSTEAGQTQAFILDELRRGPASIKELEQATGTTNGAVRSALNTLKNKGLATNADTPRGVWRLTEVQE